jgi:hypothetical protein
VRAKNDRWTVSPCRTEMPQKPSLRSATSAPGPAAATVIRRYWTFFGWTGDAVSSDRRASTPFASSDQAGHGEGNFRSMRNFPGFPDWWCGRAGPTSAVPCFSHPSMGSVSSNERFWIISA